MNGSYRVVFLIKDEIEPYLSDSHVVQADNFPLYATVKT